MPSRGLSPTSFHIPGSLRPFPFVHLSEWPHPILKTQAQTLILTSFLFIPHILLLNLSAELPVRTSSLFASSLSSPGTLLSDWLGPTSVVRVHGAGPDLPVDSAQNEPSRTWVRCRLQGPWLLLRQSTASLFLSRELSRELSTCQG